MAEPTYSESMRGNAAISTAVPRGLVDTSCLRLRIRRLRCRSVYRAFQNVCEELEPIISRFLRYSCMQVLWQKRAICSLAKTGELYPLRISKFWNLVPLVKIHATSIWVSTEEPQQTRILFISTCPVALDGYLKAESTRLHVRQCLLHSPTAIN
jgi:hypothetical protein